MDKQKSLLIFSSIIFTTLVVLNFLTVFTPEIGFDALWYHLTLPKLWLLKHQWFFPGGLLYYSVMPRLTETIYIPLISISGYIGPKLVQFLSGLGTFSLIIKISKVINLKKFYGILAGFAFYITWLVSWQSGSAYIDLFRTFLETLALFFLLKGKWIKGGVVLGLAVGTKWLSLGSLFIYSLVFGPNIIFPALLVAFPWFIIAYHFTGNPIYPLLEPFLSHTIPTIKSVFRVLLSPLYVTKPVDDFITPLGGVYVIFSVINFFKSSGNIRKIALVGILGTAFSMLMNPPSGRFLLPFLPALCISSMHFVSRLKDSFRTIFIYLLLGSFILILGLRVIAFRKYTPFLLRQETKELFLTRMKDRLPDTFVDSDLFVQNNLKGKKILIDKLHNLYYFPYDYDHSSWVEDKTKYDYLITSGENPAKKDLELIHTNDVGIQIFKIIK